MPDTPDLPATPHGANLPAAIEAPLWTADAALPVPEPTAPATPEASAVAAADTVPEAAPEGNTETASEPAVASADLADTAPAATPAARPARPPELSPAACADLLKQHFPALFGGPPKPLKLRIQADIHSRTPGIFTKPALSAFFRRYTTSTAYLIALGKAESRFDLDGQPAGELSEEHRQLARDELTRRRQISREREQQAQAQQRAQHQAQHAEETARQRAQQAEEAERQRAGQQERQARLTLLRDFERTTLTMANFCVLKGLKPEALTPLLAQARKEAAEAPPAPPPRWDDRLGPSGPRRDGPRPDGPRPDGPRLDGPRPDGGRPDRPRQDGRPQDRPAGPPRGDRRGGKPPGPRSGS